MIHFTRALRALRRDPSWRRGYVAGVLDAAVVFGFAALAALLLS